MHENRISGGALYSVNEISELPRAQKISTSSTVLDSLSGGGVESGAVWALMGPRGAGVTTLALNMARAAAQTASVVYVNGHLKLQTTVARLKRHSDQGSFSKLRLATWMPLPNLEEGSLKWPDTELQKSDLIILDTIDELFNPRNLLNSAAHLTAHMRHLRNTARAAGTAVVFTARTPIDTYKSREYEALETALFDVSDLVVEFKPEERKCYIQSRSGRSSMFKYVLDGENNRVSFYVID